MIQRSQAQSRVHQLSSVDLEKIARRVRTRYFVAHWVESTGQLLPKGRTHGGRTPLTPADPWQLLEHDEGAEEKGALLSDIVRLKTVPGRLLCEIARLQARAKQREVARAQKRAVEDECKKWEGSLPDLDNAGKARFDRRIKEIKRKFSKPGFRQEIASSLRRWGIYSGSPSRETLRRLSAGVGKRQLHAHILRIHRWKQRAFRYILP